MRKATETRLTRLLEARQEQDAATVRGVITTFLGGLAPDQLYECRQPDVCRERLWTFLSDQPAPTLATIERWAARKRKR